MRAFVDGDILVYEAGFTTQDVDQWIARARMRDMLKTIFNEVEASFPNEEIAFEIYLSDSRANFRVNLFPDYKANRTQEKPFHHEYLQNLLSDEWGAEVAFGEEADDAMSIRQYKCKSLNVPSVIVSRDKDLYQVPGLHYNWSKKEVREITPSEALYLFYKQILTGDAGDNVCYKTGLGCKGIGEVRAHKILEGYETEEEMFQEVYTQYHLGWREFPKGEIDRKLLLTGRLLKLRTYESEIWNYPIKPNYEEVQKRLSSQGSTTKKSRTLVPIKQETNGGSQSAGPKQESTGSSTEKPIKLVSISQTSQ